jgi:hypothetical protein
MSIKSASWFEVDKAGLAQVVARKGKVFILHELLQNAWDCKAAGTVRVDMVPTAGKPEIQLRVSDEDPDGFSDLTHAYTLFAPSAKKAFPEQRGRFNLGEKLVLALCDFAEISTTRGTVTFEQEGRKVNRRKCRSFGTEFVGRIRATRDEYEEMRVQVGRVIPPATSTTYFDGIRIMPPASVLSFTMALPTIEADESGSLREVKRDTRVVLYTPVAGDSAKIYEMGIPVVDLPSGVPWHLDIMQKVPLSMERDGVKPSYLSALLTAVLNEAVASGLDLSPELVRQSWVSGVLGSKSVAPETVKRVVIERFGSKAVISDPSDREGTHMAVAQGYVVVPGGTFDASAWENIRQAGVLKPAGQVTPSPKPFTPGGEPLELVEREEWTQAMVEFESFVKCFASACAGLTVQVAFTADRGWGFRAAYSRLGERSGQLYFNVKLLGHKWFAGINWRGQVELLIHELGHHWGQHLDSSYHQALCRLGAEAVGFAMKSPRFFGGVS